MRIETKRLFLREMRERDFDALYEIWADPDTMRHYPAPLDAAGVRAWIAKNRDRYRVFDTERLLVCPVQHALHRLVYINCLEVLHIPCPVSHVLRDCTVARPVPPNGLQAESSVFLFHNSPADAFQ
jgi:hypothetical protein